LLLEQRIVIERALNEGAINVLVSTTTLAAGVNINSVQFVFINEIFRRIIIDGRRSRIRIKKSLFIQMIQRAGRTISFLGKAYIIEQGRYHEEKQAIIDLILNSLDNIESSINKEDNHDKFVLQNIACRLVNTIDDVQSFFSKTYFLFDSQDNNEKIARECIDHLHSKDLISKDLKISTKGEAIAWSQISIEDSIFIDDLIQNNFTQCLH
jgi:replicative superfamily II helicase